MAPGSGLMVASGHGEPRRSRRIVVSAGAKRKSEVGGDGAETRVPSVKVLLRLINDHVTRRGSPYDMN